MMSVMAAEADYPNECKHEYYAEWDDGHRLQIDVLQASIQHAHAKRRLHMGIEQYVFGD